MSGLSERLRRHRIASGLSQAKLAEQVGLSRTAVTQIEAGNREITADELSRFASVLRQSPSSLLARSDEAASASKPTQDALLDELADAYPAFGDITSFHDELKQLLKLASLLTEVEAALGADVFGPDAFVFRGSDPRTSWEAAHQGYSAAEDERRRLDLGSAPIRDMPETLATLRIRATRLQLPAATSCVSINTPDTGPVIIVSQAASLEERRFWLAHGLAHVLFDSEQRWIGCGQNDRGHHREVRANTFAGHFLMPAKGVERYLQSIGCDTMARSLGAGLDLLSDDSAVPADKSRIHLSARSRRGAWQLSSQELSLVARYFGVSHSMVAHSLKNLRFLSGEQRDRLTDDCGASGENRAREAIGLPSGALEPRYDPFLSRLLASAAEARRRGAPGELIEPISDLLKLNEAEKSVFLAAEESDRSKPLNDIQRATRATRER